MEVTYLRLDPVQPEIDIFKKHISQQIVYSGTHMYNNIQVLQSVVEELYKRLQEV